MNKNLALALKLAVTPAVLVSASAVVLLAIHRDPPAPELLQEARSPDGLRVARHTYVVDTGYLGGSWAKHVITVGGSEAAPGSESLVLVGDGGDYKLTWAAPRELDVTVSSAAHFDLRNSSARDVVVHYAVGGW